MQCFDLESIFCRLSLSEQTAVEASEWDKDLWCVFVLKIYDGWLWLYNDRADVGEELDYDWMFDLDVVVKEWPSKRKQLSV